MNDAVRFLESKFKSPASLALVLGSGLGAFADEIQNQIRCGSSEIPGAKASSVQGHKGELVYGDVHGQKIICVSGRLHGFEGHHPNEVVYILRALKSWGVPKFILTNASGSTHSEFKPGEVVAVSDHINFTGQNPLTGMELYNGPRFPDCSDLYSKNWRSQLHADLKTKQIGIKEAVYVGVSGPSYETAAEIRMFARWGADIVGMSTVWESLALQQMGAKILCLSLVCNYGTGVSDEALDHQDVLRIGKEAYPLFKQILESGIRVGASV